jgi:hypothetical protein
MQKRSGALEKSAGYGYSNGIRMFRVEGKAEGSYFKAYTFPGGKTSMSFSTAQKMRILEIVYFITLTMLFIAVIGTPFFIHGSFALTAKFVVKENAIEALLIFSLLLAAYFISGFYRTELNKYRQELNRLACNNNALTDRLADAFKYIGGVNVQLQQIRSILCGVDHYPENDNEFKDVLSLFAQKALGMVNSDWVLIRFISRHNFRTIREHREYRRNAVGSNGRLSNKAIVQRHPLDGYSIVASSQKNLTIHVACILPIKTLAKEEKILLEAIVSELEMLFIIYTSPYYRKVYLNRESRKVYEKTADV